MKLFYLTHFNGNDYYVKETTPLGLYTTRELAISALGRAKKHYPGKWLDEMTEDERRSPDEYFHIEEVAVDRDWFGEPTAAPPRS